MTRIAALADPHVGARHMGRELEHGRHSALEDQEKALQFVAAECIRRDVTHVLMAGDLFHRNTPTPREIEILGRFLSVLTANGLEVLAVLGNHDPDAAALIQYFRGFIRVAREPKIVSLDGFDVACLPWLPDRYVRATLSGDASKAEIAAELTATAVDYIRGMKTQHRVRPMLFLAHGTVAGTTTSTGFNLGYLPETEWIIPWQELADFDLAIVGHVHRHQALEPNVVVPGSLQPLDFSEIEPKGFLVAELARGRTTWEFVPVPARSLATVTYTEREELEALVAVPPTDVPDLIRVRLRCDAETAQAFPPGRISEVLYRAGAHLVQVELEVATSSRGRDEGMRAALQPVSALRRYVQARAGEGGQFEDPDVAERVLAQAIEVVGAVEHADPGAGLGGFSLRRIELRNFMSYAEADVEFGDDGIVAITGASGLGKSALVCDAVRYALFGTSRYGARDCWKLLRRGEQQMSCAVTFAAEDGRTVRVVRKLKLAAGGRTQSTLDVLVGDAAPAREKVLA